jgi:two-component sensor histidine kinase
MENALANAGPARLRVRIRVGQKLRRWVEFVLLEADSVGDRLAIVVDREAEYVLLNRVRRQKLALAEARSRTLQERDRVRSELREAVHGAKNRLAIALEKLVPLVTGKHSAIAMLQRVQRDLEDLSRELLRGRVQLDAVPSTVEGAIESAMQEPSLQSIEIKKVVSTQELPLVGRELRMLVNHFLFEALVNVQKHARPANAEGLVATVSVSSSSGWLVLNVEDNGRTFHSASGSRSLLALTRQTPAEFWSSRTPCGGCAVTLRVPLHER